MRQAIALILIICPGLLMAQSEADIESDVSFSYIEAGYQFTRYDLSYLDPSATLVTQEVDLVARSFEASVEVEDRFYMFGSLQSWEPDNYPDLSIRELRLGAGKNFTIGEKWALWANLGIGSNDIFLSPIEPHMAEDNFGFANVGIRKLFFQNVEVRFGAEVAAPVNDAFQEEFSLSVSGDAYLTESVALTFKLNGDDDYQEVFIGVRFYPSKDSSTLR